MQTILYSLEEFLKEFKLKDFKKTLLVYRPSFNLLTFKDDILSLPTDFVHFSDFTPNPKIEEVKSALDVFRENKCDSILAIGGGSSIDVAKSVKYFINSPKNALNLMDCEFRESNLPLIAVPTTAGSGSESTPFSVFYQDGTKTSVQHPSLIPDIIMLLPDPLLSLPDYVKRTGFMDALSQAIESYWSPVSTEESRTYAKIAIEGLVSSMDDYIFSTPDRDTAAEIMSASNFAGRAISITRTSAPHAMSYKLTTEFGIAHGHAVSLSLIQVWNYMNSHTSEAIDPRGESHFKKMLEEISECLGQNSIEDGLEFYKSIASRLELEAPTLDDSDRIEYFAQSVDPARLNNNPVPLSHEVLVDLYKGILLRR